MLESDLENSLTESEYISFMSKNLLEKKVENSQKNMTNFISYSENNLINLVQFNKTVKFIVFCLLIVGILFFILNLLKIIK
jgi:hypothetical protein